MLQLTKKKREALVGLEIEAGSIAAAEVRDNGVREAAPRPRSRPLPPGAFHDGEVIDPDAARRGPAHALRREQALQAGAPRHRQPARRRPDPAAAGDRRPQGARRGRPLPGPGADPDADRPGGARPPRGRRRRRPPRTSAPKIDVVVVAARRDMIDASLKPLRDAGPGAGRCRPLGLRPDPGPRRAERPAGPPARTRSPARAAGAILYCNVGDVTNLAVAKGRSCLFTRVAPAGLENDRRRASPTPPA